MHAIESKEFMEGLDGGKARFGNYGSKAGERHGCSPAIS